ncbi:type II toxin-antitoxin system RelE/ParE family toxin [Pararcticibacter amylolyticus]|uniref:Type II toxin-antitoxin system RelE/ParE family toxin n=1 Tax=Pararcticibacter amylolyticus TaxID=2173175 RepID=A0A2U2P9Z7_9SPHI|nr:hypothetical protein DDR33_23585 [Pararcticibacter amylolyticus]
MNFNYTLHPAAQKEYEQSVKWYLKRSLKVASRFVQTVENGFDLICASPYLWPHKYKHYREYHLKKYPFTIVYSIEPTRNLVVIIAIYHQKRAPEKKFR